MEGAFQTTLTGQTRGPAASDDQSGKHPVHADIDSPEGDGTGDIQNEDYRVVDEVIEHHQQDAAATIDKEPAEQDS